ncbi:MAG: NAD(P)/FAD-dependent oxidoreductase [Candidatus Aramenus sp.]|uniref:NAD(P)/FAD-dependent oxidoreductase n=1 Tax=Candidatus Aramenus sulfurataquae TaxID=1326980 RepID=A0A0F2LRM1_9CREN|nr:NAD(P)/FAD-dependent oxidoreductase [Candidatus Aramenus sp.]MCL7343131.1 NAD(P)/FAD-dependent oxidoreductase [Candidatus Aramenus sulfurataquae]
MTGYKLRDRDPIVFDRRRFPGKKCTGIISYGTFLKLGISKEFVDREFKSIHVVVNNKHHVYFNVNVVRLNREKLETWLSNELKVKRPVNAEVVGEGEVIANGERFKGEVIDASGWKGKAKWVRAIEYEYEPIDADEITVFIDERNPGGFSWVVPLSEKTLAGSLGYSNVEQFVPKLEKRVLGIHGGAIPRVRPRYVRNGVGDCTGLIKTFTGGGIFSIAELSQVVLTPKYEEKFNQLSKEISLQYKLTSFLERTWKYSLGLAKLFDGKTLNVSSEFDFHSLLLRIPH